MKTSIIDTVATGARIRNRMDEIGLTVQEMKGFFSFRFSQAIYKWLHGASLPTVDHLAILVAILGVSMDEIMITDTTAYPVRAKGLSRAYEDSPVKAIRNLLKTSRKQIIIPDVNATATGERINQLRTDAGMTVKDMQKIFGFKNPNPIYAWFHGITLPTVERLVILAATLGVPMDEIIIVNITVLSKANGRVLSMNEDIKMTLATATKLLRAEKAEIKARR